MRAGRPVLSASGHSGRALTAFLSRDAERGIGRAIAVIGPDPLHDLQKQPALLRHAVKLEELARAILVIQDVMRLHPGRQGRIKTEARLEIGIVICADPQEGKDKLLIANEI